MDSRRKSETPSFIEISCLPPASLDAERAILGAVLLDNYTWMQTEILSVDDFMLDSHRRIYRSMMELAEASRPVDFVTLSEQLGSHKEIEAVGGIAYITSLTDGLPRVKNIEQYVRIVKENSRRREAIKVGVRFLNECYCGEFGIDELIQKVDRELLSIGANLKTEPKKISEVVSEADAVIEERRSISRGREAVGHPTGLGALDRMIKGYFKREVTVIAGESSDGKTSLMRQGIIACGFLGIPQIVFSREVSRQQLTIDLKTFISGVAPEHVRDPRRIDLIEQGKFKEANCHLRNWPLWIDDSRNLHVYDLFHKARKLIRMEGSKFKDCFIVWTDYIQLIQGSGSNQTERTEDVCAGHWTLADSENIPVVVLSQFNRESDKGKKMRPSMRRLKNASRIEQDAHTLVCPYQPENERGEVMPEQSEIIILKQRHGPRGSFNVRFDQDELIFKER